MIIIENKKIVEAKAWVTKYLIEDSDDLLILLSIRGIIDNKLISRPTHILTQEFEEILIKVPTITEIIKSKFLSFINKIERFYTFIVEV